MYKTSLFINLNVSQNKAVVLKMFFEDWADGLCSNEITYSTIATEGSGFSHTTELIQVDFVNEEDAVAMKLRGIPQELQKYLEIVN